MSGKLLFLCGKMAAGKSTLARDLAARENAMLFSQDEWLDRLYPNAVVNVATYRRYSARINKSAGAGAVVDLFVVVGVSVVLDFPGNTRNQRAWFREIIERAGAAHELHGARHPGCDLQGAAQGAERTFAPGRVHRGRAKRTSS